MDHANQRSFPQWLSPARAVFEPALVVQPLEAGRAILAFSGMSYRSLLSAFDLQSAEAGPPLPGAVEGQVGKDVAIYHAHFGAPATGMLMESLITGGARFIVQVGMAGSISPACRIGDLFVPTWGVREEGTSYHYLPPEVPCTVTEDSLARLRACLPGLEFKEGGVWTIDAAYRETEDKVKEYARRGVLAVEMECTALMAIAAVRRVQFAAVMVITDELFGETWVPGFTSPAVMEAGARLCQALARGFRECEPALPRA